MLKNRRSRQKWMRGTRCNFQSTHLAEYCIHCGCDLCACSQHHIESSTARMLWSEYVCTILVSPSFHFVGSPWIFELLSLQASLTLDRHFISADSLKNLWTEFLISYCFFFFAVGVPNHRNASSKIRQMWYCICYFQSIRFWLCNQCVVKLNFIRLKFNDGHMNKHHMACARSLKKHLEVIEKSITMWRFPSNIRLQFSTSWHCCLALLVMIHFVLHFTRSKCIHYTHIHAHLYSFIWSVYSIIYEYKLNSLCWNRYLKLAQYFIFLHLSRLQRPTAQ